MSRRKTLIPAFFFSLFFCLFLFSTLFQLGNKANQILATNPEKHKETVSRTVIDISVEPNVFSSVIVSSGSRFTIV
jgi:hypothetical protein